MQHNAADLYCFVTFDFLSVENDVNVPKKVIRKKSFLLASWRSMTKRIGSGSGSGSVLKCHGSGTLKKTLPSYQRLDTRVHTPPRIKETCCLLLLFWNWNLLDKVRPDQIGCAPTRPGGDGPGAEAGGPVRQQDRQDGEPEGEGGRRGAQKVTAARDFLGENIEPF